MPRKRTWEEVHYQLFGAGFIDYEERPKTAEAIRRVVEKMTGEELEALLAKVSIIFAPDPVKHGEVMPFLGSAGEEKLVIVYLSPAIERRAQRYVNSVVAHEFAHVLLHMSYVHTPRSRSVEREADGKVLEWGFDPGYSEYPD